MSIFEQRYKKLNKEQKEAVDTIEGPVMVVAGPGSGKTELLGLRVANILDKQDIYPSSVLCLTFTESACLNMRERLYEFIGVDAYRVAIHTFHSFGTEIIRNHGEFFYNGASVNPADELKQIEILQNIFSEMKHNNVLNKTHPEQGYVYLKNVKSAIGDIKKAGLSPKEFLAVIKHNQKSLEKINTKIQEIFSVRLNKKQFAEIGALVEEMRKIEIGQKPLGHIKAVLPAIADSLGQALSQAVELDKTAPLSAWKKFNLKKTDEGEWILKDEKYIEHMLALAEVYQIYREEMYRQGYIDFDDMLLDAIEKIEQNPSLRYELQEKFLYILVDEFQDTNDAQMRLLHLLTDSEASFDNPNIMVVGDDDQAVFKFQGAKVSNVLEFKERYINTKFITLKNNYRSNQNILNVAREVILQGEERLENLIPEIEKELIAANPNLEAGDILSREFLTSAHEYRFIAREISKAIDNGVDPNEIAVIGRQHSNLEGIVPFLRAENIPLKYERQQDVLREPHIYQIVQIARFVDSLCCNKDEADELLPEILAFPFWGVKRKQIWELSLLAKNKKGKRQTWLEVMQEYNDENIKKIADFFLELKLAAQNENLEYVFDKIIGVTNPEEMKQTSGFVSPFKDYYFSSERFQNQKEEYLKFLSSLNTFRNALREYKSGQILHLSDLIEFVDLHLKEGIMITDTSSFINADKAVSLLTAHKSKGLEFEYVFVINCQDEVWIGRGFPNKLPFPTNLPISAAGDNLDDKLRLLFVAITRAKKNLYITSYGTNNKGKESARLQFLSGLKVEAKDSLVEGEMKDSQLNDETSLNIEILQTLLFLNNQGGEMQKDEKILLSPRVENYKMSVTHLNNYLNVSRGGPQLFLDQNLLHFPQAKTDNSAYGSAMHETIHNLYKVLKKEDRLISKKEFLEDFEKELKRQRLSTNGFKKFLEKGREALDLYYDKNKGVFDPKHEIEFDFKDYRVVIEGCDVSGKIDKMVSDGEEIKVYDFKTGKVKKDWKGIGAGEQIQLHNYKRQIIFYKLLVENCRVFPDKKVEIGVLEFLEPKNDKLFELPYQIKSADVERTKKLLKIVYNKIKNLDFPDISNYSDDLKGVIQFEDDLLNGKI
jgi:DNA helicase-2/ATP-dependent DNA helicase PcrA